MKKLFYVGAAIYFCYVVKELHNIKNAMKPLSIPIKIDSKKLGNIIRKDFH